MRYLTYYVLRLISDVAIPEAPHSLETPLPSAA